MTEDDDIYGLMERRMNAERKDQGILMETTGQGNANNARKFLRDVADYAEKCALEMKFKPEVTTSERNFARFSLNAFAQQLRRMHPGEFPIGKARRPKRSTSAVRGNART